MTRFNMRLTGNEKVMIQALKNYYGYKKTSELIRFLLTKYSEKK